MSYRIVSITCAFLSLITAQLRAQPSVVISGVLDEDQLIVAYPNKDVAKYGGALLRGSYNVKNGRSGWDSDIRVPYRALVVEERNGVCKTFIAHQHFWYVGPGSTNFHVIPLDDLHCFEANDWAQKRAKAKFGDRTPRVIDNHSYWVNQLFFSGDFGAWSSLDASIKEAGLKTYDGLPLRGVDYTSIVTRDARYDLIPTGADTFTLVHLTTGMIHLPKDMLVFQEMKLGTSQGTKKNEPITRLPNSKPQMVKAPFEGDFWAYEVGGAYYLLTRKGKLHGVRFNKESVATATTWQDEKRPLIGAIQDVAKGKVYAFGVDGKDGERFAFELAFEPKPIKYKTEAKAGEGFKEAQGCIRAIKSQLKD